MNLNGNKKVILLGVVLLIVASIVVVALKGVNVPLVLEQHESLNVVIGKEVELKDVENIVKEVFKNKKIVVRKVELFNDSVNIVAESITDEEKTELVNKLNEKYETGLLVDELKVQNNSNIRVRDLIRPYIKPVIVSVILIIAYMLIRYRKMNALKLLGNAFVPILLSEAIIASVVVIVRIPVTSIVINLMAVIAVIELICYLNKLEKTK